MNPLIHVKTITLLLLPLALVCFGLSPTARAATPDILPTPDGCYPGFNTAEGCLALASINTALGLGNTALGQSALRFLTTGDNNTAVGVNTLLFVTTAIQNTGVGQGALQQNNGDGNTAVGFQALASNTTGEGNAATGFQALANNTTGDDNTAVGVQALQSNVTAFTNAAVGTFAMQNNDSSGNGTALFNTAVGGFALQANVNGTRNTAVGAGALEIANGGNDNTAIGEVAGTNLTTGSGNTYIGSGSGGPGNESGWIRIGTTGAALAGSTSKTAIGGISGANVTATSSAVFVNASGQLGTIQSSARFKKDIAPMGKTSEAILSLRPVTFRYNGDESNLPNFGLIAEDVAKVNPDLILKDNEGKPFTVRYEQINAMLLNEFLKEHRAVQELKKQVAALTADLQKVSAQIELSKAAPQTVVNNQ